MLPTLYMLMVLAAAPAPVSEVQIVSSRDGERQPALLFVPPGSAPAPLVVCLHSWSSTYKTAEYQGEILEGCRKRGWIFLSPDFRGPNRRPEACASELAMQDVLDAVEYARQHASVDPRRVYLVGGSGGGHMALQMAGRAPGVWSAVSAWVPITDLAAWYRFSKAQDFRYWKMMEQCCGGAPGSPAADREFGLRSPLSQLEKAAGIPIDIQAGINDGHDGAAVPISHSLRAFNLLARSSGHAASALSDEEIRVMTDEKRIPDHLARERVEENGRKHPVLFRRSAGRARLTIFNGGHILDPEAALAWFDSLATCATWHNRAVKLDFPQPVWFQVGAGKWTSGSEAGIAQEGTTRVAIRETRDGPDREVREVCIDLTAPAVKLIVQPPLEQEGGIYFGQPETEFRLEAADGGSGVATLEVSFGEGKYVPYRGAFQLPKGSHELRCRAVDRAGNRTETIHGESLSGGATRAVSIEIR